MSLVLLLLGCASSGPFTGLWVGERATCMGASRPDPAQLAVYGLADGRVGADLVYDWPTGMPGASSVTLEVSNRLLELTSTEEGLLWEESGLCATMDRVAEATPPEEELWLMELGDESAGSGCSDLADYRYSGLIRVLREEDGSAWLERQTGATLRGTWDEDAVAASAQVVTYYGDPGELSLRADITGDVGGGELELVVGGSRCANPAALTRVAAAPPTR